jgi:hypothetical protein
LRAALHLLICQKEFKSRAGRHSCRCPAWPASATSHRQMRTKATTACAPSVGGAGAAAAAADGAAAGVGSEMSRSRRSPMSACCGGCEAGAAPVAAAEDEGSPPETGALLSMLGEAGPPAAPSSVGRALPLLSEGAGTCAARVTKPCARALQTLRSTLAFSTCSRPARPC